MLNLKEIRRSSLKLEVFEYYFDYFHKQILLKEEYFENRWIYLNTVKIIKKGKKFS